MNLQRIGTSQELVVHGRHHAKELLPGSIQKVQVQLQFNSFVPKNRPQRLKDLKFHSLTGSFHQRNYARTIGNLTAQLLERSVIFIIPVQTDLTNTTYQARLLFLASIAYQKHKFQKNVIKRSNGNSHLRRLTLTHVIAMRMAIGRTSTAQILTHHLVPSGRLSKLSNGTSKLNVRQILIAIMEVSVLNQWQHKPLMQTIQVLDVQKKLYVRDLRLGKFTTQVNTCSTSVHQNRNLRPNALENHMRFGLFQRIRSIMNGSMFVLQTTIVGTMNPADPTSIKQIQAINPGLEVEFVHHIGKIGTAFGMVTLL